MPGYDERLKGKRGRHKRFEGESKVISFRIDKNVYEKKKDEIREKINGVIEGEVKNNSIKNDKTINKLKKK
jgi:hypothetical protein